MVKRSGTATVLLLAVLAGCGGGGGDDGDGRDDARPQKAIDGNFVGKLSGSNALVAVVASPAAGKQNRQAVTVYVADGKRVSEWFAGSIKRNSFSTASDDRDAKVTGKLSKDGVTGSIKLPNGKDARYKATRAMGAAGLYDLKVSASGKVTGASASGVGLKGETALRERGKGKLKLADGTRHTFDVTREAAEGAARLRAGQLRLIILRRGELTGAGRNRATGDDADSGFFVRSS